MYRILDLISEHGSGGLVDKIIISQDSLGMLINDIQPGAYTSMTKVDFTALDRMLLKPIGIYGSKAEIVRFLQSKGVVDQSIALALRTPTIRSSDPSILSLRPGLYILRIMESSDNAEVLYMIYWPEDTTWDANPISSVRRNRVTFMRYLTKISDQVVALICEEDASKIVWMEEPDADIADLDEDESDRMFTFEVAKTHEQEENATVRPGFVLAIPPTSPDTLQHTHDIDLARLQPRIIPGENAQGILEAKYVQASIQDRLLNETCTTVRLKSIVYVLFVWV